MSASRISSLPVVVSTAAAGAVPSAPPAARPGDVLALEVVRADGHLLGRERVLPADLAPLAAEAWREGCLRAGRDHALGALEFTVRDLPASPDRFALHWHGDRVEGRLDLTPSAGLEHLGQRIVDRCVAGGFLAAGDECRRRLAALPVAAEPDARGVRVATPFRVSGPVPARIPVRFRDLHRWAEPRGEIERSAFPVFYPTSLATRVLALARAGAVDGIETGAALAGVLLRGADGPEFGVLLTAALPLERTEATSTSLEFKPATWSGIHAELRRRRRMCPGVPEVLVGQAHGHPFLPGDCPPCPGRAECALHTAAPSTEDDRWMRLVFGTQPWALCHIAGADSRGEPVERLFTRSGGRLCSRGFHVIPDSVLPVLLPNLGLE